MKNLYVIGNGFDLHHGLNTSYRSFGLFIKKKYSEIYDRLIEYHGFSELNEIEDSAGCDVLWSDFEENLALLDTEMVLEDRNGSLASPGSSDFRDRDWGTFAIDIENIVESLTTNLFRAFKEFKLDVEFPIISADRMLFIERNALFLTFNYTDTLERYYGVSSRQIAYIHGKAKADNRDLVLGHGIAPDSFREKEPSPPEDLSPEEQDNWMEHMNDSYDYSFDLGKQEIEYYFEKSFKPTKEIINSNLEFFESIANVENIYILGHSLSEIDIPYFKAIIAATKKATFTVSYYSDEERSSHRDTLINLGVDEYRIILIRLEQLEFRSNQQ